MRRRLPVLSLRAEQLNIITTQIRSKWGKREAGGRQAGAGQGPRLTPGDGGGKEEAEEE